MSELFGRSVIYHGPFGSGLFQSLYSPEPVGLIPFFTSLEWHVVVTLGMVLLTAVWSALWPLVAISLLASVTVAIAAAVMVVVPKRSSRWLSRPLVALLYLLQPIVRGWPRYARRIVTTETPLAARAVVRSLAAQYRRVTSRATVQYWTESGIERLTFLDRMLQILDRDRWQAHIDSGWDEYDVCIYGDRLSRVFVQTVAENHGGQKRLLRVKLTANWTFLAKVGFAQTVGLALIIRNLTADFPWAPAFLIVIPLVALYFHLRTRRTMRLGIALMDYTARELGLTRLEPRKEAAQPCTDTGG